MCRVEGICLECANAGNCPMLVVHRDFEGTLRSVSCFGFKPALQSLGKSLPVPASAF